MSMRGWCCRTKALRKSGGGHDNAIWERHYQHHRIASDVEYQGLVDYVQQNPLRHGLCARCTDWQWSSLHRFAAAGWLAPDQQAAPSTAAGS
jgi:putative transposase